MHFVVSRLRPRCVRFHEDEAKQTQNPKCDKMSEMLE